MAAENRENEVQREEEGNRREVGNQKSEKRVRRRGWGNREGGGGEIKVTGTLVCQSGKPCLTGALFYDS